MSDGARQSIHDAQEEIVREMGGEGDLLEKYAYLVACGRALQSPSGIRTEEHAVPGCQSRVWIQADVQEGRLRLSADSDAVITRGIIALLIRVLDGHSPAEVRDADLFFLDQTGLSAQLSPSRANGLAAMVRQIRECARSCPGSHAV